MLGGSSSSARNLKRGSGLEDEDGYHGAVVSNIRLRSTTASIPTSDAGSLEFESGGLSWTRSSRVHPHATAEAERAVLVKGEAVKLVDLRRVRVRKTAESVVPSLEADGGLYAAYRSSQRPRVHSITSEIHVDNNNDDDDGGHYNLATKPRQVQGDLRLPWIWVEGWRARLRMSGDVVEKCRWEWKMDDAPGIRKRAGTVVSQIPSMDSVSAAVPTPTHIKTSHAARGSDPGPGSGSGALTQTQMHRLRAVTVPGVFARLDAWVLGRGYVKDEIKPRRKSVRWASILG